MTNHMPHEGPHDHPHVHPPMPMGADLIEAVSRESQPPPMSERATAILADEAIQEGARLWLAREFVGGLVAMAQATGINVVDFLAEKCMVLSMRTAVAESATETLQTRITALDAKLAECNCHDETSVPAQPDVIAPYPGQDVVVTNNGDGS